MFLYSKTPCICFCIAKHNGKFSVRCKVIWKKSIDISLGTYLNSFNWNEKQINYAIKIFINILIDSLKKHNTIHIINITILDFNKISYFHFFSFFFLNAIKDVLTIIMPSDKLYTIIKSLIMMYSFLVKMLFGNISKRCGVFLKYWFKKYFLTLILHN